MLQDPVVKPPDGGLDELACSRSAPDRRQKTNANPEQALKCPRCDSANTKFCYYNNYSLTQPRHFCKNCRRYWTKGGTLRNVPVGGGCRKNKRVKQRTIDPSSLVNSLDESATNMLANINNRSCSALLPNFPGPSSSSFGDLSSDSHMLSVAFSRFQESLRLGEQSESVSSNPALFGMGVGCSQPSVMTSMPSYDNGVVRIGYATPTVKSEHGTALYDGSDYGPIYETPIHMTSSGTGTLSPLEEHLSNLGLSVESFNACNAEAQFKFQQQKLAALQLASEEQREADRGHVLPAFEDETHENMRYPTKGKCMTVDGCSLISAGDWQQHGMTENLFDPTGDHHNFWSQTGWPDMHAIATSATGAMM